MPISVTSKIKQIIASRDRKLVSGSAALNSMLEELRKEILAELLSISADTYSAFHLKQSLASIERHISDFSSAAQRESGSLIQAAWTQGAELLPATAQAAGEAGVYLGTSQISTGIIETLQEFTFGRMKSISSDLFTRLQGELTLGILGQKTPQQIASQLGASIKDLPLPRGKGGFAIFKSAAERAEVVVQLEMGRAFSIATEKSIEAASGVLPELQRMWIHAGHPRAPRQSHLMMHGQTRGPGKVFYRTSQGAPVRYPRDPAAPISEVIRCGCDHVPYMARWGSAQDFAASWDQTQYAVNYRKAA